MKDYEDRKYEQWRETTELILPTLMKKSLLTKVRLSRSLSQIPAAVEGDGVSCFLEG